MSLGGGKAPKVKYTGPSPDEIRRQAEQQAGLLREQEEKFRQQYQQQFESLRGAYENSVNILTKQFEERDKTQAGLLNVLQQQYDAAESESVRNRGLYEELLKQQRLQEAAQQAEQYKAQLLAERAQSDQATRANQLLTTMNQRRLTSQESRASKGSMGAYNSATAPLLSLLR